jgi:hypothetical protein
MLSCFARASQARGGEINCDFGVVKTESDLLNLVHETLHYEKSDVYNFHCFGCCHGSYGSTR